MRTTILLILLSTSLSACAPAPSVRSSEAERDLHRGTEATIRAVLSADTAFFERLLAEDYVGTAGDGRVTDEAAFLRHERAAELPGGGRRAADRLVGADHAGARSPRRPVGARGGALVAHRLALKGPE